MADGASLYDRFGPGYTLLRLDGDGAAADAIAAAAAVAGVPLTILDLRTENLRTLYGAPLALVRPDQYVAWRGGHANLGELIETIRGSQPATDDVLGRKAS